MKSVYLGIDVGSVSTNVVIIDNEYNVLDKLYIRTMGAPIKAIQESLHHTSEAIKKLSFDVEIAGVGTTGSGRNLAGIMVGADIIKNEITTHAVAALTFIPNVKTIIEIGGQDSKIIIIKNNIVADFAMNTVCAAGTGSFLDRQAARLGIPIEDFGNLALKSNSEVRIAGRCAVFAESDMIHKQQLGYSQEDIINGLCEALVRNYLTNLAKGKDIKPDIVFQGGVAANLGIKKAFEKALNCEIHIPTHYNVMGAIGAAILAKNEVKQKNKTSFKGLNIVNNNYNVKGFECNYCPNVCEVIGIYKDESLSARWGDKCGRWSNIQI